jgi:uncharacterized protein
VHRRPFLSLVTPDERIDWRLVVYGFGLWVVLIVAGEVVTQLVSPAPYRLAAVGAWLALLPAVLVLTSIQTTVEEFVFRAWMLQWAALLGRSWIWLVQVVSLPFALPHIGSAVVRTSAVRGE